MNTHNNIMYLVYMYCVVSTHLDECMNVQNVMETGSWQDANYVNSSMLEMAYKKGVQEGTCHALHVLVAVHIWLVNLCNPGAW